MTFRLGPVNVICTSLERSLAFYRDVLGFELAEREEGFARLQCGDRALYLLEAEGAEPQSTPYCQVAAFSLDLEVEDIEAAFAHFQACGARFARELEPGGDSFFVMDPDGLVLEVVRSKGEAMQT